MTNTNYKNAIRLLNDLPVEKQAAFAHYFLGYNFRSIGDSTVEYLKELSKEAGE